MRHLRFSAFGLCGLLATTALVSPAAAQSFQPMERQAPDENGIDVISGKANVPFKSVSIGNGDSALTYVRGAVGAEVWGGGLGGIAGAGLSSESSTPSFGTTTTSKIGGAVGYWILGGSLYYSKPNVEASKSIGVGPRLGYAAGSLKQTTHALYLGRVAC